MSKLRQRKGQWAESVVQKHLQSRHYEIIEVNHRSPWAQIDLLVRSPLKELFLIETKFIQCHFPPEQRLGDKQRARLRRAQSYIASNRNEPVGLVLALVSATNKIEFINLDDC